MIIAKKDMITELKYFQNTSALESDVHGWIFSLQLPLGSLATTSPEDDSSAYNNVSSLGFEEHLGLHFIKRYRKTLIYLRDVSCYLCKKLFYICIVHYPSWTEADYNCIKKKKIKKLFSNKIPSVWKSCLNPVSIVKFNFISVEAKS